MTFWPFGQNSTQSNIQKILQGYLQVLHNDNAIFNENDHNEIVTNQKIPNKNNGASNLIDDEKFFTTMQGKDMLRLTSSNSSPTYDEFDSNKLDSSFIDMILEEPDLINELMKQNESLLDFFCLGYFYVPDDSSTESDQIDTHSNNSSNAGLKKVNNIEYLINILIESIDHVDASPIESKKPQRKSKSQKDENSFSNRTEGLESTHSNSFTEELAHVNSNSSIFSQNGNSFTQKANIISEILSLDIWLITETLVKNHSYLFKIWSIIKHPKLISENSQLVPIFLKINQNLLLTRQDQYLNFIRVLPNFVDDILKHVHIALIMDFFLKCISTDKFEAPTGIIELLRDQNLIEKILNYFDNEKYESDIQSCVCDFLKALIAISANAPLDEGSIGPNSLTRELSSPKSIKKFLEVITVQRGAALHNIVAVVVELIRKNNSDYDQVSLLDSNLQDNPPSVRDPIYLGYLLKGFSNNLEQIFEIVRKAPSSTSLQCINQINETFYPLGFDKFKIIELIAELLHCSNMAAMNYRKVEKIAKIRDDFRNQVGNQLKDALKDLSLNSASNFKNIGQPLSGDDSIFVGSVDSSSDDEIDESFEIPYINDNQNEKLRNNCSIGDLFKIQLHDLQIIPKIMELFLSHPWNNFWHNVIFDIVQQLFNGRMDFSYNSFLIYSLFNGSGSKEFITDNPEKAREVQPFQITNDFLLRGYKQSYDFYETNHMNLGFMGHLVLISEEVVKFSKLYKVELISPNIFNILQESRWIYYTEVILNNTRIMYSKILGGGNFVDDGNGNIIPQLPKAELASTNSKKNIEKSNLVGESNDNEHDNNNNDNNQENVNSNDDDNDSSNSDNGNKVQFPSREDDEQNTESGDVINMDSMDDHLRTFTELDLHNKLSTLWIDEDAENKAS